MIRMELTPKLMYYIDCYSSLCHYATLTLVIFRLVILTFVMGSVFMLEIFVFGDGFCDMITFFTRGYRKAGTAEKVVVGTPSSIGKSTRS